MQGDLGDDTADNPTAPQLAAQVEVSPVDQEPHTSKEAQTGPGDSQVNTMAEPKDVKVETKIVMMTNTPVQVLKYQVPREDEIHEFKEVLKTQPLAKILANLTQPGCADKH